MGQASSAPAYSSPSLGLTPSVDVPAHPLLNVKLQIVSAYNLHAADHFKLKAALKGLIASSDPFTAIQLGKEPPVAWTHPVFSTRTPRWNETFHFNNVKPDELCTLYLMDKGVFSDEDIGQATFTTEDTKGKETVYKLPIKNKDDEAGTIKVKVKSHVIDAIGNGKLLQYGPVHYSVHPSRVTGILTNTVTDEDKRQSFAYHVRLHDISLHLPTDVSWNKEYKKVRRVFSPDHPEATVLRSMAEKEHDLVFKHDTDTIYGEFEKAADFFELINGGKRQGKMVLFTYVIVETGFFFCETGAPFFKDMLSKHMLLSRTQFHVRYAGEFFVTEKHSGGYTLHIDNNSGTYAPPENLLPQVEELLKSNFHKMSVKAVDREDEEQKKTRKKILEVWDD
uniref:C2 domain-containing protein n=1 Tax=Hyaloperonospora arabidopsidis (strain Emoy2) TaxID=559515 RepID=M4C0E0_HYAAE